MLFKILSISLGWFEVDINREFILVNSDFMGCDAPFLLLEALGDLLENKTSEAWLCWQDEPGAYILKLEKQDDRLIVQIYDTEKNYDSTNLDYSGITLREHVVNCLYEIKTDFTNAARNILDEFALYENGNGRRRYYAHWGGFPQLPYQRVKNLLNSQARRPN